VERLSIFDLILGKAIDSKMKRTMSYHYKCNVHYYNINVIPFIGKMDHL